MSMEGLAKDELPKDGSEEAGSTPLARDTRTSEAPLTSAGSSPSVAPTRRTTMSTPRDPQLVARLAAAAEAWRENRASGSASAASPSEVPARITENLDRSGPASPAIRGVPSVAASGLDAGASRSSPISPEVHQDTLAASGPAPVSTHDREPQLNSSGSRGVDKVADRDLEVSTPRQRPQKESGVAEASPRRLTLAQVLENADKISDLSRDVDRIVSPVMTPNRKKLKGQVRSKGRPLRLSEADTSGSLKSESDALSAGMTSLQLAGPGSSEFAILDESDLSDFHEQVPELALDFPFELDDFQKRAVLALERNEDCFVAAHTSAGKTVVAEYAVALAQHNAGRVVYTSPIKSLSNQKFRDFSLKFDSVGITTGDMSIRQDSQCLIMTTEILRSVLYKNDDMLRSVDWVIFDEIQYVNDEERGVVWETCIMMLPPHVRIIMLSATVPNALEFAAWVGRRKNRRVTVVATHERPVPLEHSLLHLDLTKEGSDQTLTSTVLLKHGQSFRQHAFAKATKDPSDSRQRPRNQEADDGNDLQQVRANDQGQGRGRGRGRGRGQGRSQTIRPGHEQTTGSTPADSIPRTLQRSDFGRELPVSSLGSPVGSSEPNRRGGNRRNGRKPPKAGKGAKSWQPLVDFVEREKLTPTIVFLFSKKKCADAVDSLQKVDILPDGADKSRVHSVFDEAMAKLQEEDRNIPQIMKVRDQLSRGLAVHHAGLLPIVKEVTEILFSQGLVRLVFATETFATGVNFPAKSVIFAAIRKHDGKSLRYLECGEYTQMSGRAGRRGKDDVGRVFLYFPQSEPLAPEHIIRKVLTGKPLTLKSAFRLTYSMILNILRVDELRIEDMMKSSFGEAAEEEQSASIQEAIEKAEATFSEIDALFDSDVGSSGLSEYADIHARLLSHAKGMWRYLGKFSRVRSDALRPGRLVLIDSPKVAQLMFAIILGTDNVAKARVLCLCGELPQAPNGPNPVWSPFVKPAKREGAQAGHKEKFPFFEHSGWRMHLEDIATSDIVWFARRRVPRLDDGLSVRKRHSENTLRTAVVQDAARFLSLVAETLTDRSRAKESLQDVELPNKISLSAFDTSDPDDSGSGVRKFRRDRQNCNDDVASLIDPDRRGEDAAEAIWSFKSGKMREAVLSMGRMRTEQRMKLESLQALAHSRDMPVLLPEYKKRVTVLQRLQYIGEDGVTLLTKARQGACEVATVDCVLLTEIILENTLDNLEPAEVASLLAALICRFKGRSNDDGGQPSGADEASAEDRRIFSPAYLKSKADMRNLVRRFGAIQEECGVDLAFCIGEKETDYESAMCRWGLSEVVLRWAEGLPFADVIGLTDVQEGDIVHTVRRLAELLKDCISVARAVGNDHLRDVLVAADEAIRRDIIFSASLYIE